MALRFLLALPILFLPNALHLSGQPLVAGLNFANVLFLVVLLGAPLLAPRDGPKLSGAGHLTPALALLYFSYLVAFVIAQLDSPGRIMDDLTALKTAIFYPLFYLVFRHARLDLRGTRQLIVLTLIVAVVAGLEAVRESVAANMLQEYSPEGRASGPFGVDALAANLAGYYYAMFLPMFVAPALFLSGHKLWRLAAIGGAVIVGLAIMATFSRQAYAVAVLCLFLVAIRRSLLAAALIGLLAVAGASMLPTGVTQRIDETTSSAEGSEELDTSTASRFEIWAGAMQMWRENPAGVGMNRFKSHIGRYSTYSGFDAHNHYVLTLAEAGPLGLAALLWLFWRAWALGRSLLRSPASADPEARALAVGSSLLVVAMAMGNTFGSLFVHGLAMGSVWAFLGLMERYGALKIAALGDANARPADTARQVRMPERFPLAARVLGARRHDTGGSDAV